MQHNELNVFLFAYPELKATPYYALSFTIRFINHVVDFKVVRCFLVLQTLTGRRDYKPVCLSHF